MKTGASGLRRLRDATRWSFRGLGACWRHEAAFRQEIVLCALALPVSLWLARDVTQWILLILPLFALLAVELLNSAIESIVDRIGPERHELSGRAKDLGSAAVFICLAAAAVTWSAIAWHNLTGGA